MFGRNSCTACHGAEYRTEAEACPRCADIGAQVEDWLRERCPGSVSGSGGHNAALKAASACWGFLTDEGAVLAQLRQWNATCSPPWSEKELRHKVASARQGLEKEPGFLIWRPWTRDGSGPTREARPVERPLPEAEEKPWQRGALPFDITALKEAAAVTGPVSREQLQARSVCRLDTVTPELFLSGLYAPGERVLVFTKFASQGQYLWNVPGGENGRLGGAWQLAPRMDGRAERAERLPREGNCGVWFLNQPIDGKWREVPGKKRRDGTPEFGRRHEPCVTDWPYMVLESDIPGIESLWVAALCGLRLPLVALYTSGGKSVHGLVRLDARTKHMWDVLRDKCLKPLITKLGGDPGVFSAVRLTRLPGTLRHGTEDKHGKYTRYAQPRPQELLYYRPDAQWGRHVLEQ